MIKVLITGLIASGKSEVCAVYSSLGYPVYDSDSRCKALYDSVPGLKTELERLLGIPFSQFGQIFEDESKRKALEAKVYPLVREDFHLFCSAQSSPVVFFESAVASDKEEFAGEFDRVILVRSPRELRFGRNPKASSRSALQSEPEWADYVIDNDGSLEQLRDKALEVLNKLKK